MIAGVAPDIPTIVDDICNRASETVAFHDHIGLDPPESNSAQAKYHLGQDASMAYDMQPYCMHYAVEQVGTA